MKALVIYDDTGRIWTIMYGEERVPQGLQCMWVDIPDGARLDHIDVTNAGNPQPVFVFCNHGYYFLQSAGSSDGFLCNDESCKRIVG